MKVLLIAGGSSGGRVVSLKSRDNILIGLEASGHDVYEFDPANSHLDLNKVVEGMDVGFITLQGGEGENGRIQKRLEMAGLPYVGSGVEAMELCSNKYRYKEFLLSKGYPASRGALVGKQDMKHPFFKQGFVLKPNKGGSSIDTIIAHNPTEESLHDSESLLEKYDQMLLEPIVEGVEITVSILDDASLPVIEIIPPQGKVFDYENKYNGASQEFCPPRHISEAIQESAQKLALGVHNLTGCRHISRTDMMVDDLGSLHILETNTAPGMTKESLFPKAALAAGHSMAELVDKLVALALNKN